MKATDKGHRHMFSQHSAKRGDGEMGWYNGGRRERLKTH